jgi:predicted DNA-binding transcriptional regulator YafY
VTREAANQLRYLGRFSKIEKISEPDIEGWQTAVMRFHFEQEAAECLIGLGKRVQIIEPLELRNRILALAKEVLEESES